MNANEHVTETKMSITMAPLTSGSTGVPSNFTFTFNTSDTDGLPEVSPSSSPNWWKTGSCYQIWPASFKDGNGDGLGDIPGILSKLDYLADLGVDIIWLSPMYASPQIDMGYDISDYNAVYPPYGTMEDMESLIKGLHDRGMKLILDLVVNHTSDQHKWFRESRKGHNANEFNDWYIWKDPKILTGKDGKEVKAPPNNWGAFFGGSAWEYCEERDQYYLHLFEKSMPDLNWENPATRRGIHQSALKFWFKKGVDGFRVDTANLYSKVQTFADGPVDAALAPYGNPRDFVVNGPRIHEFYKEMRAKVLDKYNDPMMVGELGGCTFDQILEYVSSDEKELSMVFDFDLASIGGLRKRPWHEPHYWELPEMKTAIKKTQDLVANTKAWSTVFAENHDLPRSNSRYGAAWSEDDEMSAKVLAMMLGTLSGTLFLYQGQEIGMSNIPTDWSIEDIRDVASLNYWQRMKEKYHNDDFVMGLAWCGICQYSRDNARTPVQWSTEKHAGFTPGTPWMRVNDNYKRINVASQLNDKDSVRSFWQKMLKLRKTYSDVFVHGRYHVHDFENRDTFTFEKRAASGRSALVMLSFVGNDTPFKIPDAFKGRTMKCVISNEANAKDYLGPWEGRVYVEQV